MGPSMDKAAAIAFFDGSPTKLARAVGLKSRQAIYKWPDEVPDLYQPMLYQISDGALPLSPRLAQHIEAERRR